MTRLDEAIERVAARQDQITRASNDFQDQLRIIERRLQDVRATVWLDVDILVEREGAWQVGFAQIFYDKHWGFVVRRGRDDPQVTALIRAPRKVRVAAAPYLADVVELLHDRLALIDQSIQDASAVVEQALGGEEADGVRSREYSGRPGGRVRTRS